MKKILLLLLALVVGIMWLWFGRQHPAPLPPAANIPIVRKNEGIFLDHKQVHTIHSAMHSAHSHYTGLTH